MLHRIIPALLIASVGLGSLALTSCGDYRAVSSRHHMSHYQTSYDSEVQELPWRPPALGDVHYPRSGNEGYQPGQAKDIPFSSATHPDQRWRAGRRSLPYYDTVKH